MAAQRQILDFYAIPGPLTSAGKYVALLEPLPGDVSELVRIVQGLAIHEYMAGSYSVTIPDDRKSESHIRQFEKMIERLLAIDPRPLTTPRPPENRLVGVCDHFMRLLVAMLRFKGIPARGRYGFGAYFNQGYFEDHSVCEYWNAARSQWVLVDPQFDEVWRTQLKIDHDILDVPRDRLLVAADAWTRCRTGAEDAARFGIIVGDLRGLWFIAGTLVRDLAALNKMEMLQWDVWGSMPTPGQALTGDQLEFFDRIASLTAAPDASFDELRRLYESDDRLRVPATVFNAVLNRPESIEVPGL